LKRFLIVTADDFGLHEAVNEAVELGSRAGVLTAASLMVAAPAAADAVRRAHGLPDLRVGLHVVLADGLAMLPPETIPDLCDADGRMDSDMLGRGVRFFASPRARRQLEAEIRAQFAAFARTGLALDHVNAHKHFHLHPTLLGMLVRIGREFRTPAIRVPAEPLWFAASRGGWGGRLAAALLGPLNALMRRRLRAAGLAFNDRLFGVAATGAMDESTLLSILARLGEGITEIYLHPAVQSGEAIAASMSGYRHADELAALLSLRVRDAVNSGSFDRGGYSDAVRAFASRAA
jgi:hopanoid biosynthesis associated protein HpnK